MDGAVSFGCSSTIEGTGSAGTCAAGTCSTETSCSCIEGGVVCPPVSVGGFEVYLGAGSSSGTGATSGSTTGAGSGAGAGSTEEGGISSVAGGSTARAGCGAGVGVAGVGGISLIVGGSSVGSGDAVTASPLAKGEGPTGSEASAAASLAGLSAIGLGVPLPFPEGGDSAPVSNCLIDPGLEDPLMEAESESRSRSEGLGEAARTPGMLNAVEERRITVPTRLHRFFLDGGEAEIEPGGVVDIVEIDRSKWISGKGDQEAIMGAGHYE